MNSLAQLRTDYSDLVEAILKGNDEKANELLDEVIPRLEEYLQVVMGAEEIVVRECVQQAFVDVFEQIRKNKIKESKYIFSYLVKSCRHEYYRYVKRQHKFEYDEDIFYDAIQPEEQFKNLLDKERQKILEECLEELRKKSLKFILYFMDRPDATTVEASEEFDISGANVRTKKHRILSRLHHCYKRKSNQ